MDSQQFRSILLKLQDRLSDDDRKRLHFFFGNDVPRRIRDDPSLGGTLSLMESLFDQDKINEQDFTVLIKAFNEIRCFDAVNLLKGCISQMQSIEPKPTFERLSSIMPSTPQLLLEDQEDDKFVVKNNLFFQKNTCTYNNNIIGSKNSSINPFIFTSTQQTESNLPSTEKKFCTNSPRIQMCLTLFTIVLIIILAILTAFFIHRSFHINELEKELQMKNQIIIDEKMKNNETNQTNTILKKKINDFEKEQNISFIRTGIQFGGVGGSSFDDSSTRNFTCSHYLRGMVARRGFFPLNGFQFLYSSPYFPENIIEGEFHGTHEAKDNLERFLLDKDERVIKIQVLHYNESYYINDTLQSIPVIKGLRLFTTKGRASPSFGRAEGIIDTEQFEGYIASYATGRDGLAIDQIQFHWQRMPTD